MNSNNVTNSTLTRRDFLKTSGTVLAGAAVAGGVARPGCGTAVAALPTDLLFAAAFFLAVVLVRALTPGFLLIATP